jgi:hypothetical protein
MWGRRSAAIPIPVSRTSNPMATASPSRRTTFTARVTDPRSVNFTALPSRFVITCPIFTGSPASRAGTSGSKRRSRAMPFSSTFTCIPTMIPCTSWRRSNTRSSSRTLPAAILLKSRMSLISASRLSDAERSVRTYFCCASLSGVIPSRWATPTMALSGVRISWLMTEMNSDFARSADSAAARARSSSRSYSLRWVASKTMVRTSTGRPASSVRSIELSSTGRRRPSARTISAAISPTRPCMRSSGA